MVGSLGRFGRAAHRVELGVRAHVRDIGHAVGHAEEGGDRGDVPGVLAVPGAVERLGKGRGEVSAHQLAAIVASDQALTAKLLRLSNSAYYGFARRITSVRDAVVLLGFRAVNDATFTVGTVASGALPDFPTLDFYTGTVTTNIPAGGEVTWRIYAPAEATQWRPCVP